MSWEYTIICDGCGRLVAAGSTKSRALHDLHQVGGRQAGPGRHGTPTHLCPSCADKR